MAEDESKNEEKKSAAKETAKKGAEEIEKAGLKAAATAVAPELAPAVSSAVELPLVRKIINGILIALPLLTLLVAAGLFMTVIAIFTLFPEGFKNRNELRGELNTGGGYIVDPAFTSVKNLSANEVMGKLSRYENLKGKQAQVQMIIDKSRAAGISYYLLLDIWVAEQTFGNDAAAMGCGVYGGANRAQGFESQVDCAIGTIKKTLNNQSPYNEPMGENNFTRLFYNYTSGMQDRYKKLGYVAECNDNRLILHRLLAPEEVVCSTTEGSGPGVALVGDKLYPPLGAKMGSYLTYSGHSTWCCGYCTTCAVDYSADGGTPIYALTDGKVRGLHPYTSKGGQYRGYTFFFFSNDGLVYATYAHLNPTGKLSKDDVGLGKDIQVKKGDLLGSVYPGLNSPHLHFEMKINGETIGMTGIGGTNNQLKYFGKVL